MSDDISIPRDPMPGSGAATFTRTYRARRPGMDATTKRMLLAAGALATLLVGGMGVWALRGPQHAGVPTIEADSAPLRVKPTNPGGMHAIGALDSGADAATGVGDLAPAAERPDPQALLAQRQIETPTPTPAQAAAPTPAPAAAVPAPAAASEPASAGPATPAQPSRSASTSGAAVQLASVGSEAAATAEWARLQKKAPELLGGRQLAVERADVAGRTMWRLRTGGFADMADATIFCRKIRAKGLGCSLATF